jgi:hypothetical protein
MKRWYVIVTFLYGLLFITLTFPIMKFALQSISEIFSGNIIESLKSDLSVFTETFVWSWLLIIVLAQAAFLTVPVAIAAKRPVKKRSIISTVIAASFMMALLIAGVTISFSELIASAEPSTGLWWISLAVLLLSWLIWGAIFWQWSKGTTPENLVKRQRRYLFHGSILELLIVVPTHIVVRQRDYCCAGFGTFTGIACGIAVMLFAFGPGILYLYASHWHKLHPNKDA